MNMGLRLAALQAAEATIADSHFVIIWVQLPEILSFFRYYLNFEASVGFI